MANLCDFKMAMVFDDEEKANALAKRILPDPSKIGTSLPGGKLLDCAFVDVVGDKLVVGGEVRWSFTNSEFVDMLRAIGPDAGLVGVGTHMREDNGPLYGEQRWSKDRPESIESRFLGYDEFPKWECDDEEDMDKLEEADLAYNDKLDAALNEKAFETSTFTEVDEEERRYRKTIQAMADKIAKPLSDFKGALKKLSEENRPSEEAKPSSVK